MFTHIPGRERELEKESCIFNRRQAGHRRVLVAHITKKCCLVQNIKKNEKFIFINNSRGKKIKKMFFLFFFPARIACLVRITFSNILLLFLFQISRTAHLRRDEAMASEESGQQVGSLSRSGAGTSRQFGDCSAQRNSWRTPPPARQQRILRRLQIADWRPQIRVRDLAQFQQPTAATAGPPRPGRIGRRVTRIKRLRLGIQCRNCGAR